MQARAASGVTRRFENRDRLPPLAWGSLAVARPPRLSTSRTGALDGRAVRFEGPSPSPRPSRAVGRRPRARNHIATTVTEIDKSRAFEWRQLRRLASGGKQETLATVGSSAEVASPSSLKRFTLTLLRSCFFIPSV